MWHDREKGPLPIPKETGKEDYSMGGGLKEQRQDLTVAILHIRTEHCYLGTNLSPLQCFPYNHQNLLRYKINALFIVIVEQQEGRRRSFVLMENVVKDVEIKFSDFLNL